MGQSFWRDQGNGNERRCFCRCLNGAVICVSYFLNKLWLTWSRRFCQYSLPVPNQRGKPYLVEPLIPSTYLLVHLKSCCSFFFLDEKLISKIKPNFSSLSVSCKRSNRLQFFCSTSFRFLRNTIRLRVTLEVSIYPVWIPILSTSSPSLTWASSKSNAPSSKM